MHLMCLSYEETEKFGTVQSCMETSFNSQGKMKLMSVPNPVFILGMPRSNRIMIHYTAIVPNPVLDIRPIIFSCTNLLNIFGGLCEISSLTIVNISWL